MSWQDYVDKQLLASGFVNHAAIIGTDGALWAKSAAFNVSLHTNFSSSVSPSPCPRPPPDPQFEEFHVITDVETLPYMVAFAFVSSNELYVLC